MLGDAALEREVADQQTHDERATHVLEQCGIVESRAKQSRCYQVDAVAQRGADAAAEKYDQESHDCSFLDPGNKKTALRRLRTELPPQLLRGRSHQPSRAVSGDSIPIAAAS